MTKKHFFNYAVAAACVLMLSACDDKKADEPDVTDDLKGEMEQMTPAESKKFLEETANEVLGKFRAADQRDIIALAAYFEEEYGDLDAPREFVVDESEEGSLPGYYVRQLAKAVQTGDASRAGAAAIVYTYSLDVEKYRGIYEPLATRWSKVADSKDIVFRFSDQDGKQCELKAAMGSYQDNSVSTEYEDEYYDFETGTYVEYVEGNVYKFRTPKDMTVTLTCGGKELSSSKVNSDISVAGHSVGVTANVKVANIDAAVKITGTDSQIAMTASFSVSGEQIVSSSATVKGTHLCDFDYLSKMDPDDENDMMTLLQSGEAMVSVLNKVRTDATVKYNRSVYKALNGGWDNYEYDTQSEAERDVKSAVEALNNNVTATVHYNNKETVQATLFWKYIFDDYSYGWYYEIEPLIKFASDGTTYSFDEYFERGFTSVEDLWDSLLKSYEKVWESSK